MSESTSVAAAQPAPSAQTSAVEKPSGENVSGAQMKQILLARDLASKQPQPTETAPPPATEPATTPQPVENQPASDSVPAETTETPAASEQPEVTAQTLENVLSNLSSLDPETRKVVERAIDEFKTNQQAQIDKRIGKERAKRGETERLAEQALQEVQALRAQLQQTQQAPQPSNPSSPIANANDLGSLASERAKAVNVIGIVDDALALHPSAEKITVDGQEFERSYLIELRRTARERVVNEIPARQVFLQQRDQANDRAFKEFDFLRDPSSPDFVRAQQLVRENNHWMQNMPDMLYKIALQVEGEKARAARKTVQSVAPRPAAPAIRPPSSQTATSVGAAPERVSSEGRVNKSLASIEQEIKGSSNMTGARARQLLKQSDQLRNSK